MTLLQLIILGQTTVVSMDKDQCFIDPEFSTRGGTKVCDSNLFLGFQKKEGKKENHFEEV